MGDPAIDSIVEKILAGDRRLAARLMRDVDDALPGSREVLAALYRHTGRAHIVGVTGNPGAGKSTLLNRLIKGWRARGKTVAVVAIDPTSPFSGGAILGDRIRMQDHALDPGVFIRSVATRGHLGGLSRSTDDLVNIFDAMGFDLVVVETVGVGQDEIDVVRTAHTSLVVLVPGLGDEIQALKAGILEIADIFVVNKADREGADRTAQEIRTMMTLGDPESAARAAAGEAQIHHGAVERGDASAPQAPVEAWYPPVHKVVATRGQGVEELIALIEEHAKHLQRSGLIDRRRRLRVREGLLRQAREALWQQALLRLGGEAEIDASIEAIAAQRTDPYSEADRLTARVLAGAKKKI